MTNKSTTARTKRMSWTMVLLAILVSSTSACGALTEQTEPLGLRQPFSARSESEDGAIVAWSGFADGYEPGAEADFEVRIENQTDETWHGRFCLQLVDRRLPNVVGSLAQQEFTLQPGVGFSDTVTVQVPEGLGDGTYGLSMAVRRPSGAMIDLIPIEIGEAEQIRWVTSQRHMNASLDACPPVEGSK